MLGGDYSLNPEYIFYRIYELFTGQGPETQEFLAVLAQFWWWLRALSILITIVLVILLVWLVWKVILFRKEQHFSLRSMMQVAKAEKPKVNDEWQRVLDHMASGNPNEWKLGIIAADNLLDSLVKAMQVPGESLGERLKNIESSDFGTLNEAWEAHKVRNRIAHEVGYEPTEVEARRAIANYRKVFEEFRII